MDVPSVNFRRLQQDTREQNDFSNDQALPWQEGKVICVRLALFAEMMKGKPWTPATLKEVGGTKALASHSLKRRSMPPAAPRTSAAPKSGPGRPQGPVARIRHRHQGPHAVTAELLEASGYANRPKDFDDLIRILDGEIRLITPTDPEGKEEAEIPPGPVGWEILPTHPRLSRPLLARLADPQAKETRRGRAELRLAERAAVWKQAGEPPTAVALAFSISGG